MFQLYIYKQTIPLEQNTKLNYKVKGKVCLAAPSLKQSKQKQITITTKQNQKHFSRTLQPYVSR